MRHFNLIIIILIFFFPSIVLSISFNVFVEDEIYPLLEEMEAIGAINSQIYGIKPFSMKEVARLLIEAEKNKKYLSPYLKKRLKEHFLKYKDAFEETFYFKPIEDIYLSYYYVDEKKPENILGRKLERNNLTLGFGSKLFLSPHLLFHSQFEIESFHGDGNLWKGEFLMGYTKIGFHKWYFEAGIDSIWWGQGYTGTLINSLNPAPFSPLFKIETEQPIILPWIFHYLGLIKLSVFLTRLEENRYVPHPYLLGMKISLKPMPILEIGLFRSAMFGGRGRKCSLSTILFAKGENVYNPSKTEGDQKAGLEVRFRPIKKFVIYWEGAGEDEAGGFPSHWAHIVGFYMPQLWNKLGIRFEYANITRWWYEHHIYKAGYRYHGNIIGYYTGRNVKNYFGEISYDLTGDTRLISAYWHEEGEKEIKNRFQLGIIHHFIFKENPFILIAKYRYSELGNHDLYFQLKINF